MSIEKIKSMRETLEKMEDMQKQVNKDIDKDINKKRKEALKKIRAYMDDVADALDGVELSISLSRDNQGLIFGSYEDGQYINFNKKYRVVKYNGFTSGKWSDEPKNWYIDSYNGVRESDSKFFCFIDNSNDIERETNKGKWAEGFINLIENWNEIKAIIEREVEKQLTERMEKIRKDTAEKIEKYEKVNDFEA